MRILHLTDRLSARGGADLYVLSLLRALADHHEVHLAVERQDGTAVAPCPVTEVKGLGSRGRSPVDLGPLLESFQPDALHLHNIVNPSVLESVTPHPCVMTVHDHRSFCPGRGKWTLDETVCTDAMSQDLCKKCFLDTSYFEEILSLTQARFSAIRPLPLITLSQYMKSELVQLGIPARQIQIISPFVDGLDPDAAPAGKPCILFVGRLVQHKGVQDALNAWKLSKIDLPLVFAGTGSERESLEAQGAQVLGWVSHEKMSGLYKQARALLMPSRWQEPFGMTGIEALSMGTPVVAWESGAIGEWHPSPQLPAWGDVDALAAGLNDLENQSTTLESRFTRAQQITQLEQLYDKILQIPV